MAIFSYLTSQSKSQNTWDISLDRSFYERQLNEHEYFTSDFLDRIINLKSKCRAIIDKQDFPQIDARKAFFVKVENSLQWFYFSNMLQIVSNHSGNILKTIDRESISEHEFNHLLEITTVNDSGDYLRRLKLHLVFDIWICFESSLSPIFENYLSEESKVKTLKSHYERLNKFSKDIFEPLNFSISNLTDSIDFQNYKSEIYQINEKLDKLKTSIKGSLIPQYTGVISKCDRILSKIESEYFELRKSAYNLDESDQSSKKNKKKVINPDKRLLELFNAIRNSTHYNMVSVRKIDYETRIGRFKSNANEVVCFLTEDFILNMINELIDIFDTIARCTLDFRNIIWETAAHSGHVNAINQGFERLNDDSLSKDILFLSLIRLSHGVSVNDVFNYLSQSTPTTISKQRIRYKLEKLAKLGILFRSMPRRRPVLYFHMTFISILKNYNTRS